MSIPEEYQQALRSVVSTQALYQMLSADHADKLPSMLDEPVVDVFRGSHAEVSAFRLRNRTFDHGSLPWIVGRLNAAAQRTDDVVVAAYNRAVLALDKLTPADFIAGYTVERMTYEGDDRHIRLGCQVITLQGIRLSDRRRWELFSTIIPMSAAANPERVIEEVVRSFEHLMELQKRIKSGDGTVNSIFRSQLSKMLREKPYRRVTVRVGGLKEPRPETPE